MDKRIQSALISVFYKDGLEQLVRLLAEQGVEIYSTGGTQQYIEKLDVKVTAVENITSYPSILGGRVKTLHPSVFGGILGRRDHETDPDEMRQYNIPEIDLVIVDLYPFQETVAATTDEKMIIEKIDIGGPSLIRAAAKNHSDVVVIANKEDYASLADILEKQDGTTTLEQRRAFAANAFEVVKEYDIAISEYFNGTEKKNGLKKTSLRYGENPHQQATFTGELEKVFEQLHGKEISYNNLVDIDAAIQLISEFEEGTFAIIKHTNVCGIASRENVADAWKEALAGDPESAFGGVLISNRSINIDTAESINEIFFEVLIAPAYDEQALNILKTKKNRILLKQNPLFSYPSLLNKSVLNGILSQDVDRGIVKIWKEEGGRVSSAIEKRDLEFANKVCKHLKSNAIALVKNLRLVGKGCGQTSRIDSLRQAIEKGKQFNADLAGTVMASDAFFPFDDCVKMGHAQGITAFIQPGGSVRDKDSIEYCKTHQLVMILTEMRHFRH